MTLNDQNAYTIIEKQRSACVSSSDLHVFAMCSSKIFKINEVALNSTYAPVAESSPPPVILSEFPHLPTTPTHADHIAAVCALQRHCSALALAPGLAAASRISSDRLTEDQCSLLQRICRQLFTNLIEILQRVEISGAKAIDLALFCRVYATSVLSQNFRRKLGNVPL